MAIHAYMWSWGKTCDSLDAIPSVTMGNYKFKVNPLMNSNMTLTVLNLYQKSPSTTKIQVKRYESYKRDKIVSHIPVEFREIK